MSHHDADRDGAPVPPGLPGPPGAADEGPGPELVSDVFARGCTSRGAFEAVTGRWSSLALLALAESDLRFNALRRRVEGVSEKMLSQTLQGLERDGMVTRHVVTAIPPRVEYRLTALGERVAATLRALADLLEASTAEVESARTAYARRRAAQPPAEPDARP